MRKQGQNCYSYRQHHNWMWLDPFLGCPSIECQPLRNNGDSRKIIGYAGCGGQGSDPDHAPWGPAVFNPWHFCLDPHRGPSARLLVTALA